jgi:hypothetical protein
MASGPDREKKPLIVPITPATKGNSDFKEFIGFLARTDAIHDFGSRELKYEINAENINMGLSEVTNTDTTNEHGALWNVLIDLPGESNHSDELKGFLNSLSTEDFSRPFQVGFRSLPNFDSTTGLHTYTAKRVDITDGQRGYTLKGACGLEDGGTLVVDFNQNGFLDKLSKAETGPKINVVTNAQTINDGAGKTKYNDPILKGRILQSIIDKKNKPTIYSEWSDNDITANNLFLTSYQLEVTPVIEVKSVFGKIQKLSVNITVSNLDKKTKTVIKDAKKNNSIGEILKKIRSIIAKFRTKPFEVNEAIQRKRNGDWGQATSCFTLDDGEYYGSDLRSRIDVMFNLDTTYYVTHDHIAAAYVLLLGLNLLFLTVASGQGNTHVEKRVYIFKNNKYVSNPAESYRDILSTKDSVLSSLRLYNIARDQLLNTFTDHSLSGVQSSIFQEIIKLGKDIDTIDYENGKKGERIVILKDPLILKNKCIAILDRAYLYQQIKQTTPDPNELIKVLEPGIPADLTSLKKMYEAFIAAQNINKLYNSNTDFDNIIAKIKISNVYLTLKHWTYTKELRTRDGISVRLGVKIGSGEQYAIDNQDKFAFIPFLVTCDSAIKRPIVKVFRYLLTKLTSGNQFIAGAIGGRVYDHALLSFKILCETVCIYLGESIVGTEADDFKTLIKTNDKTKIDEQEQGQPNLLSQVRVIEENQKANTEDFNHLVDSLVADSADAGAANASAGAANATAGAANATAGAANATAGAANATAGAPATLRTNEESLSGINADIEENLLAVRGDGTRQITQEQKGGVFELNHGSLPRLLNHNSVKEATHVMLTAHLLLNVPATGGGARTTSQNRAIANHQELISAVNPEFYISARPERGHMVDNNIRRVGGATPVITNTEISSPSLPIYFVLEGLREVIPRLNGHQDYDDYVTYYLLLESMNEKLKEHPLPLIGFALREILITFISTQVGRDTIAPLFDEIAEDYNLFPLTTTTISADVCGSFVDYDEGKPEVIELAKSVIESVQVKRYIHSVIDTYKKKSRRNFYTGHKYNLKLFIDKVNKLQESIGKEIIHDKTTSKSKSASKRSMKKLTNLIGKIYNFMTKRNRNMAILKNRSAQPHNFSASRLVKVRGGKGRKTMRRR